MGGIGAVGATEGGFGQCKCLKEGHTPNMSCMVETLSFAKDTKGYFSNHSSLAFVPSDPNIDHHIYLFAVN